MKAATVLPFTKSTYATISIHAAREGGDCCVFKMQTVFTPFQSTPPVKAATVTVKAERFSGDISIHAAREGGDDKNLVLCVPYRISIHAAREGGDLR